MAEKQHQVDFDFLRSNRVEGYKSKPYVPICSKRSVHNENSVCYGKPVESVIGKSGITVGGGIDLGQQSAQELLRMGIPNGTVTKVQDLLGQRKESAKAALMEYKKWTPAMLTSREIRDIDEKFKNDFVGKAAARYAKETKKDFFELPPSEQTVIYSILHQYGQNTKLSWIVQLMVDLSDGKSDPARSSLLEQGTKGYKDRRQAEADLLSQGQTALP